MIRRGEVPTENATPVTGVLATERAIARLSPIGARQITHLGGFWGDRQRTNRERTIPRGFEQLGRAGNLSNLRLAAGAEGRYRALGQAIGLNFPFLDTDVYKWLEAVAWELGRTPDAPLAASADEAIELIERAQRPDGYLNSFVQVVTPGRQYEDLAWGHELYCLGHLIQAAVAWHRAIGDDRLLNVAIRAADSADRALGPSGRDGIDGHPEVEMALVELYRVTGERRYLDLAARQIELRGAGRLGDGRFGPAYWQDHAPVGEAETVAGHAVRQLYLDCGAVDVAVELGDSALLGAVQRRWRDMIATRTYLTGGVGSRHLDEAFGDPYELPPDRAYAETCGAIASVMLAWRLLLATGDPACADVIERAIYNGVLSGVSLDGTRFFYVNPLQRRSIRAAAPDRGERAAWFPCACCPPNLMRLLGSWEQYLATTDPGGIQIHQFATAGIVADVAGGTASLSIETELPWNGRVKVTVNDPSPGEWSLSLRIPGWSAMTTVRDDGEVRHVTSGTYWESGPRTWRAGDEVILELDMRPRITVPDRRIDAVRGCVALERGPLVYSLESADLPTGVALEEVRFDDEPAIRTATRPELGDGVIGLDLAAFRQAMEPGAETDGGAAVTPIEVRAIPYFAWANRSVDAMRVWVPRLEEPARTSR